MTLPTRIFSRGVSISMNTSNASPLLEDLHTLERFLRGSNPGFGRSFAELLLTSLRTACQPHGMLTSRVEELADAVQEFVGARASPVQSASAIWGKVEQSIAELRAAASRSTQRDSGARTSGIKPTRPDRNRAGPSRVGDKTRDLRPSEIAVSE